MFFNLLFKGSGLNSVWWVVGGEDGVYEGEGLEE